MDTDFSFKKAERISLRKEIESLFENGKHFNEFPLHIIYCTDPEIKSAAVSALISVPKKRFKKAVDRNRIKRLIRESYRLNKSPLVAKFKENGNHLSLCFVYADSKIADMKVVNDAVCKVIDSLIQNIECFEKSE
ncbi:MAG: ribonuclease P protein component [Dysgonamonadaceae bacterium]|nr:ribonuclease P protein component [Dysgonamonadaceae bacterium]